MRARQRRARRSPFSRSPPRRLSSPSARTPADIVLLETGLGGRLDATNVIRRPAVDRDHPDLARPPGVSRRHGRGDRRREGRHPETRRAGGDRAAARRGRRGHRSPRRRDRRAALSLASARMDAARRDRRAACAMPGGAGGSICRCRRWPGAHQIANAGIALACLEQLRVLAAAEPRSPPGLRRIEWPARLQRLTRGPLAAMLPPGWELWLDGGHNPAAGLVLAEAAASWRDRPLDLVVGMLNTKDAAGFLAPLAPHARALHALTIPGEENPHPAARSRRPRARSASRPRNRCRSRPRCALLSRARGGRRPGADLRIAAPRGRGPRREPLTAE